MSVPAKDIAVAILLLVTGLVFNTTQAVAQGQEHAIAKQAIASFKAGDHIAARRLYAQSCRDEQVDVACHNLGLMFEKGQGGAEDPKLAREAFRRACIKGLWQSCARFGRMALDGIGGAPQPELAQAALSFACTASDGASCHRLGNAFRSGTFGGRDLPSARRTFGQGCDTAKSPHSCHSLAIMMRDGSGGPVDRAGALKSYGKACDQSLVVSCVQLGSLHHTDGNFESSRAAFSKACDADHAEACLLTGMSYYAAQTGVFNEKEARRYLGKSCSLNSKEACDTLERLP